MWISGMISAQKSVKMLAHEKPAYWLKVVSCYAVVLLSDAVACIGVKEKHACEPSFNSLKRCCRRHLHAC